TQARSPAALGRRPLRTALKPKNHRSAAAPRPYQDQPHRVTQACRKRTFVPHHVNREVIMLFNVDTCNDEHASKHGVGMSMVAIAVALALPGCAVEVDQRDQDPLDQVEQGIENGESAAANLAVVQFRRYGNEGNPCSGYFITRRHIVTSAHCTADNYSAAWYEVRVKTGYSSFTSLKESNRSDNWILLTEYEAPGWNWDAEQAATDMAILTLGSAAWDSVPANQDLMRVSTAAPYVTQALGIWGWGAWLVTSVTGALLPNDLLTAPLGAQIYVSSVPGDGSFRAISNTDARTCTGDSGRPATRYYNGYYIAAGTHRGASVRG
ncbi:trypsin-like serine protease, partial [Myxococcota bacterium]